MRCGSGITACMGFVLARDILSATDGRIPWTCNARQVEMPVGLFDQRQVLCRLRDHGFTVRQIDRQNLVQLFLKTHIPS